MVIYSDSVSSGHVIQSISTHSLLTTKLLQVPRCCHPHFSCTDLDTTSYTSALAFSGAEVLHVLQSQGQIAWLMAGLQKKTTYRSAPFPSSGDGARDALEWKATRRVTSEVVRVTAGWTRPDLILWTSTSAFTRLLLCSEDPPFLCSGGSSSLCGRGLSFLCGGDGRRFRRNSKWSSGFTQMDPDRWLDISAWFISWMKLLLGLLGLWKD